jgi:hypothetical protein
MIFKTNLTQEQARIALSQASQLTLNNEITFLISTDYSKPGFFTLCGMHRDLQKRFSQDALTFCVDIGWQSDSQ